MSAEPSPPACDFDLEYEPVWDQCPELSTPDSSLRANPVTSAPNPGCFEPSSTIVGPSMTPEATPHPNWDGPKNRPAAVHQLPLESWGAGPKNLCSEVGPKLVQESSTSDWDGPEDRIIEPRDGPKNRDGPEDHNIKPRDGPRDSVTVSQPFGGAGPKDRGPRDGPKNRVHDSRVPSVVQVDSSTFASPFALELFAGSSGLSFALCEAGIRSIPVDHSANRFNPKVPQMLIDLTTFSGQSQLWTALSSKHLVFVHLSPPCGTSSRAREKPLPKWARDLGWPQPSPLRSEEFPLGIPDLAQKFPWDVARVAAANKLYSLTAEVCRFLSLKGIPWTLENPRNSLFWWISEVDALLQYADVGDIFFQHCMHGGTRDKWTRLRCSPSHAYQSLALVCDRSHTHEQWGPSGRGKFFTADEAAFPDVLCSRIANIVCKLVPPCVFECAASVSHVTVSVDTSQPASSTPAVQAHRIAAGTQPRGNASPAVIPEYRATALLEVLPCDVDKAKALVGERPSHWGSTKLPPGSRVLSLRPRVGGSGSDDVVMEVGIPHTPSEFTDKSLRLEHPFDVLSVDDGILRSVFATLTRSASDTRTARDQALAYWRSRARDLDCEENRLRAAVHEDVARSISGKRILLFREMLESVHFPHAGSLTHKMATGFPLAGEIQKTDVFVEMRRPASSDLNDLWRGARESQQQAFNTIAASGDSVLDDAVTETTADEVERGWLRGPFTAEDLTLRRGLWVPARRFGIRQGESTRVIDDYSEFGQNACVGTSEKVDVGGVDTVANIARGIMAAVDSSTRRVAVTLADGTLLEGDLHADWTTEASTALLGKVWDLSKAYRQLARNPAHSSLSVIATWNSRRRCIEFYEQLVLPFGSTASVYNFNWTARGLQWILVSGLGILCTHYFDDFPTLEFKELCSHTQGLVDAFFELLGWDTKHQKEFATSFEALGVICDLADTQRGIVRFRNKPSRVAEITATVQELVSRGYVRRGEARAVRGRILFARGQTFGRCGAAALRVLGDLSDGTKGTPVLDNRAKAALSWLTVMLRESRPREIQARIDAPVILFVDGACEEREGQPPLVTIGAVLFDSARPDLGPMYFGCEVGEPIVSLWSAGGEKTQVIGQAELLPVLLAKTTWPERFRNRSNITFIDNNSARFGLIRGYSPVAVSASIIGESWLADMHLGSPSWFARVPTHSNIADEPSRLRFAEVSAYPGAVRSDVAIPESWGRSGDKVWVNLAVRLAHNFPSSSWEHGSQTSAS
jgi:hypothetical protein